MSYNQRLLFAEIDERFSTNPRVSLSLLALDLGVHRHTLENAVQKFTGMSFSGYRQKKLVTKAVSMLCDSPFMSIKCIAVELGYQSPAAFTRFLRSKTGKTPSAFRV
jgi:AraC-like DNA-binding protein